MGYIEGAYVVDVSYLEPCGTFYMNKYFDKLLFVTRKKFINYLYEDEEDFS